MSVSEPRHGLDDQHSWVDRLYKAFVRSETVGFEDLIDRVGRNKHQDVAARWWRAAP